MIDRFSTISARSWFQERSHLSCFKAASLSDEHYNRDFCKRKDWKIKEIISQHKLSPKEIKLNYINQVTTPKKATSLNAIFWKVGDFLSFIIAF